MEETMTDEGTTGQEKPRKKRKSSNYSLERYEQLRTEPSGINEKGVVLEVWREVLDGFVSPKAAMAQVSKDKMQGVFRVVRVATPAYAATVIPQEPIWSMEKVKVEKNGKGT